MIQRIQTLWLLLSSVTAGIIIKWGILKLVAKTGQYYLVGFAGIRMSGTDDYSLISSLPVLEIVLILIPLLSFFTIFLYKRRRAQKILTLVVIILALMLLTLEVFFAVTVPGNYNAVIMPGIRMILPAVILIFSVLAYRGIRKDENLIRSYERLR